MSEREDSQTDPLDPASKAASDLTPPAGNRPAQNARQVSQASHIQEEWRSNEAATDFLGLDQTLRSGALGAPSSWSAGPIPGDLPSSAALEAPTASDAAPLDPSNSWLMSLDESESNAAVQSASSLDPEGEEPAGPAAPEELEMPQRVEAARSQGRARRWLVRSLAALCVASLGAALYKFALAPRTGSANAPWTWPWANSTSSVSPGKGLQSGARTAATTPHSRPSQGRTPAAPTSAPGSAPGDTRVTPIDSSQPEGSKLVDASTPGSGIAGGSASAQASAAPIDSAPEASSVPGVSETVPAGVSSTSALTDGAQPSADSAGTPRLARERAEAWLRLHGESTSTLEGGSSARGPGLTSRLPHVAWNPAASGALPGETPDTASASEGANRMDAPATRLRDWRTDWAPALTAPAAVELAPAGPLRSASAEDLAGVWEGATIPMDKLSSTARILTPAVGRVRVTLRNSEVFEGRLYAIGQERVWIDTDLGRMALMSDQVRTVEQLSSPDGTAVLGRDGSQVLAGLPRVRVRMPGGMFYGRIVARDETTLTLITDEGGRVRLESTDFEPVPPGNVVIVRSATKP